jgi:tryptophan 2,3-dioxygenase
MANLNDPILPGTAATDYERYLRTDELLSLQKSAREVSHRDEHLFQAVHQTSELWLKFACGELEDAIPLVESAQAAEAIRLLRRANDTLSLVIDQLHMLEHISPIDYAVVRTALGHGAGFDSPGFRRVHHLTPLLGAAFERLLETRGLTLREVYEQGHSRDNEYQLAEQLITWDERGPGTSNRRPLLPGSVDRTRRDYASIGARRRRPRSELNAITLRPRAAPPARYGSAR